MSRVPLQFLPTFVAVARAPSLRAAADQLHLTHSAISQQIRLLEEQLGFALFERSARRLLLTGAGASFLRTVEPALAQIQAGARVAAELSQGTAYHLRLTLLPSFAQRWLLPRMARWRQEHPDIALDLHTSLQVADLKREGFHAALRQGTGPWRGLEGTRLVQSPLIVVAAPLFAERLLGRPLSALLDEPLLGDSENWERWFAQAGHPCRVHPVASFNDMGLMLQAAEQGMGVTLGRQLMAADALRAGRLVQLFETEMVEDTRSALWLLHPPELVDWPPLQALRAWLESEFALTAALQTDRVHRDP
ncbi:LysR substrate-binding domain-containing protein [Curvibacter sp. APW13]|nr:LysR substrate-binding domain-containing protein [Curvibacter sp. APW13]MDT8992171.1 LysR substrate-binding domain-containing protein [Curvibacter sp. APW13]